MTRAVFVTNEHATGSFEPLMLQRTREMIRALEELGVRVEPVSLAELQQDPAAGLARITTLAPDFITAPNFNYLLLASVHARDLFHLDIPLVAIWDDPIGALVNWASYSPTVWAAPRRGAVRDALQRVGGWLGGRGLGLAAPAWMRAVTDNPSLIHFAWDSGHVEAMRSLGLVAPERVHWYPVSTFAPFLDAGRRADTIPPGADVAFCGNLYLNALHRHPTWQVAELRELTERLCRRKADALHHSNWRLLLDGLDRLPRTVRQRHGLYTDRKGFWDYYLFVVWCAMNSLPRLEVLRAVRRPVSLFGLFADPDSVNWLHQYRHLRCEGNRHQFDELPQVFASTRVNLCISNGLIYQGVPSKLIDCLASGGFALCDPKDDLVRLFGRDVERIFFRDVAELNDKIDYYLARPGERAEIVAALQAVIRQRCTLTALYEQVLATLRTPAGSGSRRVA